MQKNTQGFSLIIGIGLVILISLSSFILLDTIIPFSKNTKGIEQSTSAYYFAGAGIEDALYRIKSRSGAALRDEYGTGFISTSATGVAFQTFSSGSIIPPVGSGNSEIDKNFNQLSFSDQIQLEVGRGWISPSDMVFQAKVPAFASASTLSGSLGLESMIHWVLSSGNNTLNASGSWITVSDVNNGVSLDDFGSRAGLDLFGAGRTFGDFYTAECAGTGSGCTFKMSLVRDLLLTNGNRIPYLEYQINFGTTHNVPLRYTRIQSSGKSYGFKKDLEVNIPQDTINQAFDFTVFQ